ncbi:MAG: hypothetical protein CVU05_11535 [Bacteroidetes bacterium HGW-Bacteroidetes-21]|jgi:hypothetical protein|nr:MAG: hypothetical protein CVU05_11535 [Bacteroidetes bacterium HGW-Bacteroidetes-21]
MKKLFFSTIIILALFSSCEQLAEEDTPVCKDCMAVMHLTSSDSIMDTTQSLRLCGGDVISWENFQDKVEDSTTTKYSCK